MTAAPIQQNKTDWFSPGKFALLLGLFIVAAFPAIVFGGETFVIRDFGLYGYPLAWYHRQCFWQGEIPMWNPYNCCGMPFLAQYNTITLYPLSLIYLLFPMPWSLSFYCLAHQFLAGLGMYFLATRWTGSNRAGALAGVIMAFNGLTLHFLMWPNHIASFAWMPWVILAAENAWREGGRKIILAGLAAAMQILAGSPETSLFTWLFLLALFTIHFIREPKQRLLLLRRFLLMSIIAGALTSAQLFPFLDFVTHSQRDKNFASAYWPMPKFGWGNFFLPMFQGSAVEPVFYQGGQYWTSSYYAGIGVIGLAMMALWRKRTWRVWLLGAFIGLSLILALGNDGLLYAWLKKTLPVMSFFRFPIKFVIATLFALPLLAAHAISYLEEQPPGKTDRLPFGLGSMALALIGTLLWFEKYHPVAPAHFDAVLRNGIGRIVFLAGAILAIHFFITRPRHRSGFMFALIGLIWFDLLTHEPWQNPGVEPTVYDATLAATKLNFNPQPALGQSRLMMSPEATQEIFYHSLTNVKEDFLLSRISFQGDCNLLDGLPKTDGFFPLYVREFDRVFNLTYARTARSSIEDLMAVSQTSAPGKYFDWETRTNPLPMVSVGQRPMFEDDEKTFAAMTRGDTDFRKIVYLPKEAKSQISWTNETRATVTAKHFQSQKAIVEITAQEPAIVLISQADYHWWKAYVDEQPSPLWRADYAFQAVAVPAGHHVIRLAYEDRSFQFGAILSLAGLIGCGLGWFAIRKKI